MIQDSVAGLDQHLYMVITKPVQKKTYVMVVVLLEVFVATILDMITDDIQALAELLYICMVVVQQCVIQAATLLVVETLDEVVWSA
jgi:hypothetical protein